MPTNAVAAPPEAFVAPADLGLIEVTGSDRASYLQAVLSQDVAGLQPGEVRGALQLTQHGAPVAVMDVVALMDRILLLTPGELADQTSTTLQSRTFLADAKFTVADVVAWAVRGQRAATVAGGAGLEIDRGRVAQRDGLLLVGRDLGLDLVGPDGEVAAAVRQLVASGAVATNADMLEAWRVDQGVPGWGCEIRAPHLPEEIGILPTHVHLDKGCYPGQEAVARMWMLGRPRRRLARVLLSGAAAAGWSLREGRQAVEVTSAATVAGRRVGLAYVPAHARPGDRYADDRAAVVVRDLVGEGLPVPGHDPSVPRRRDRGG